MYLGRQPNYIYLFLRSTYSSFCVCVQVWTSMHMKVGMKVHMQKTEKHLRVYPHLWITLRWDSTVLLLSTPDTWLLASSLCLLYPHRSPEITAFVWAIGFQALDLRNAGKYFYPLKHLFIPKSQFSETNHIYIYVSTCVYMHAWIEILNNF